MKTIRILALALPLAAQATGPQTELQRCRGLADPAARLACYDAIVVPAAGAAAPPLPSAAPTAATKAAPVAAAAATQPSGFGLPPSAAPGSDRIESRVAGRVEGFPKGLRIQLENGQVWRLVEAATGFYSLQSPKVTVRRGMFSGYVMDIEGVNALLKVERLQ